MLWYATKLKCTYKAYKLSNGDKMWQSTKIWIICLILNSIKYSILVYLVTHTLNMRMNVNYEVGAYK